MILRLVLGDQLNEKHTWFQKVDSNVLYLFQEVRSETDYVVHHIQKVVAIFLGMRHFAEQLRENGHRVEYLKITDSNQSTSFVSNIEKIIKEHSISQIEYQEPDEYRVDENLKTLKSFGLVVKMVSSEHFLTNRADLKEMFVGKKTYLMESFYRKMRVKWSVLVDANDQPLEGKWNFDHENRKKWDSKRAVPPPFEFAHDARSLVEELKSAKVKTMGRIDPSRSVWPINRTEALQVFHYFLEWLLPLFGDFQDSMVQNERFLFHSRISFALNVKMLHPLEVIQAVERAYQEGVVKINQAEGFIRQILGWREFVRGMYWAEMPQYAQLNHFNHKNPLPDFFWTGETDLNCLSQSIGQSLDHAYAHHIQRLMIIGNYALISGIDPDEVDRWYLGVYIDAFEWVELPNTRGMSQFADGGKLATKPYASSANYIQKMGNYCQHCKYNPKERKGPMACPFNQKYWDFIGRNAAEFRKNPRMSMMVKLWEKLDQKDLSS